MYSHLPQFVLGFHGCDQQIAEQLCKAEACEFQCSSNDYDWLGHGVYFWENSPDRALEFAQSLQGKHYNQYQNIETPSVVGAVIDLGNCLNLLDYHYTQIVAKAYNNLQAVFIKANTLPKNKELLHNLDCAVIQSLHQQRDDDSEPQFDTVRGSFIEGEPIFPGAGIYAKSHIQICVRNPNCIKGIFRVLTPSNSCLFSQLRKDISKSSS